MINTLNRFAAQKSVTTSLYSKRVSSYGANASGKSNIIKAVDILQKIALEGVPKNEVEPFKLATLGNKPSKVEMEFKVGKKYYAYGVEFSVKGIAEEWLFEINSRSDMEVFTRKVSADGNEFTFWFLHCERRRETACESSSALSTS